MQLVPLRSNDAHRCAIPMPQGHEAADGSTSALWATLIDRWPFRASAPVQPQNWGPSRTRSRIPRWRESSSDGLRLEYEDGERIVRVRSRLVSRTSGRQGQLENHPIVERLRFRLPSFVTARHPRKRSYFEFAVNEEAARDVFTCRHSHASTNTACSSQAALRS